MLHRRPNTFAQTILSLSFFACDKAADHTFRLADNPPGTGPRNVNSHRPEHEFDRSCRPEAGSHSAGDSGSGAERA